VSDPFEPDLEEGVAFVTRVGSNGAYACARNTFDACCDTQDASLADVERQLVEALADIRALREKLKRGVSQ